MTEIDEASSYKALSTVLRIAVVLTTSLPLWANAADARHSGRHAGHPGHAAAHVAHVAHVAHPARHAARSSARAAPRIAATVKALELAADADVASLDGAANGAVTASIAAPLDVQAAPTPLTDAVATAAQPAPATSLSPLPPAPAPAPAPAQAINASPFLQAPPSGSLVAPNIVEALRDGASDMVLTAMRFLGAPYRRGGTGGGVEGGNAAAGRSATTGGFDCSGFTRHIFELSVGRVLPHRADEQAKAPGFFDIDRTQLRPGDLVFFNTLRRTFSHVGIYVGDGKFIHAPRPGETVRVEDMRYVYWARRFTGARRLQD